MADRLAKIRRAVEHHEQNGGSYPVEDVRWLLAEIDRLTTDLRFAAERHLRDGSGANFRPDRCTGRSSDALAWYAVGARPEPRPEEYPADLSDLGACERTYEMAPPHVQRRMLLVLEMYRQSLAGAVGVDHG